MRGDIMIKSNTLILAILLLLIVGNLNAEIIEIGVIDTPGDANDVTVIGELAYIADSQAGLRIIDISNPEELSEIGFFDTPGTALGVSISGAYAYIADGNGGLCIVDISDPENPQAIGAFQGQLIINEVIVNGDYVYLADLIGGLRVINVSDPENPEQVGICNTPDLPQGFFLSGQHIYIADRRSGLQIVDVSNPEQPEIIGSIDTPGEANAVFVQNDHAYIADKVGGLRIIDISDPANPAESGSFDTEGLAYDVTVSAHYAYIADGANGFLALNIGDPENPILVGGFDTPGTSYGIDFAGGYVFVADGGSGLKVLQLTPEIMLSDEELDFVGVDIGEIDELILTITNEGHNDLVIWDIMVEGQYFSCDFEDHITLDIDESHEFTVTFSPEWFGVLEGTLTIVSNDLQNADLSIGLLGFVYFDFNEEKITADDAAAGDRFGNSISISGDYAVIGAQGDDDNGDYSGSAYIFFRDGGEWTQQAKLTADDAAPNDYFGFSVCINGDYAVVGALGNDDDGDNSGSAYIFIRDVEEWTQQVKLTANDANGGDSFGYSVSMSGEYAIIGAHYDDDDGGNSGSAYIFIRDVEEWTQQVKLTADDASVGDLFGKSVCINGDQAVIGAYGNRDDGNYSGSAYIFNRSGDDWTQQAKLTADDAGADDRFGFSVSIDGDYSAIGADGNDDDGDNSGSAYIFIRNGDDWTQQAKLTADDAGAGDCFGYSISISGDYAIIGAQGDDDNGDFSGSAYIFVRTSNRWTQQAKLTADDAAARDQFGALVSIDGDYAVVGAYCNDDDGDLSGSAYIYSRDIQDHPVIIANQEVLEFGEVMPNSISELELIIRNDGQADLRITNISIEGEDFLAEFDEELIIEPEASEEVMITFAPEEAGEHNGILTISSNDPLHQEISVELTGIGIPISAVHLTENWNLTSINVYPPQDFYQEGEDRGPDVIQMMEQLRIEEENHHVLLMKNEDGRFYLPAFDFNNIPYWELTEGYQVKVDEDVEAVWAGDRIPADTDIPLERDWNMIAYFPTYELDASAPDFYVLSPIIDNVEIAKDNDGNFMLPAFNFSNMPPWRETQGYQLKVDEEIVLNYPEMQEEMQSSPKPEIINSHWSEPVNTGNNMSVLVTSIADEPVCSGSQIAAFSSEKQIVGSGVIDEDGRCGLAVWGDDPETPGKDGLNPGEAFELRVWTPEDNIELETEIVNFIEGEALIYTPDTFIALDLKVTSDIPLNYQLSEAFPNPFNAVTRISFSVPDPTKVSIQIFDISGRLIETLVNNLQPAGRHSITWNSRNASSGVYLVRMETSGFKGVRKVVLVR
jgi:hypothetical protein